MNLTEKLSAWMAEGRPVGFSPWRDAENVLWGVITHVAPTYITVDEISPLGQPDGSGSFRLSSISYFQFDPVYSERLIRLREFEPTRPDETVFVRDRKVVRSRLEEAAQSGEICRIRLRSETWSRTVRVLACSKDWVEFTDFDDLMAEQETMMWRVSTVEAIQWRTAHEEADEFLLGRAT
jgi:hypothetical protein